MNQIIYEYPLLDIDYPYMVINIMNYKRNSTPKQKPEPDLNDEKKEQPKEQMPPIHTLNKLHEPADKEPEHTERSINGYKIAIHEITHSIIPM